VTLHTAKLLAPEEFARLPCAAVSSSDTTSLLSGKDRLIFDFCRHLSVSVGKLADNQSELGVQFLIEGR
jgi:hypothetical protein